MKRVKVRFFLLDKSRYKKIRIRFWLKNVFTDMSDFKEMVGVEPCVTREFFPQNSPAKPYWYTEVGSQADNIEEPMTILLQRIRPRLHEIIQICRENEVEASFEVLIRTDYADRPDMTIPPSFFPVFEQLNAEIEFDIAYEW